MKISFFTIDSSCRFDEARGIIEAAAYDTASVSRPAVPPPAPPPRRVVGPPPPCLEPPPDPGPTAVPPAVIQGNNPLSFSPLLTTAAGAVEPLRAFTSMREAVAGASTWARAHPEEVAALRERVRRLITPEGGASIDG